MSDFFGDEGVADFEQQAKALETAEPVQEVQEEVEREVDVGTPEPTADVGNDSKVPLAALNEARAQLRQTQAEVNAQRQTIQELASMKAELDQWRAQRDQQTKAQQEQEFNNDPLGVLQKQMRDLAEAVQKPQQQMQQEAQQAQVFTSIATQVNEFKKTIPDYDEALQFVLEARKQEWLAMGTPEYEAQQRIAQEAQDIAVNALRAGQNPGKVVYELANLRGFKSKQNSVKLETIAKGQESGKSLAGASGGTDRTTDALKAADLPDKDFDAWWAQNITKKHH